VSTQRPSSFLSGIRAFGPCLVMLTVPNVAAAGQVTQLRHQSSESGCTADITQLPIPAGSLTGYGTSSTTQIPTTLNCGGPPCVSNGSCSAPAPACGQTTNGVDNCGTGCTKTGGVCACVPDGSCSAAAPACGTTTYGVDNCNNSCSKTGGACVCVPNCSCAASTCNGTTCSDGCGGTCNGTRGNPGPWAPVGTIGHLEYCQGGNISDNMANCYCGNTSCGIQGHPGVPCGQCDPNADPPQILEHPCSQAGP